MTEILIDEDDDDDDDGTHEFTEIHLLTSADTNLKNFTKSISSSTQSLVLSTQ